MKALFMVALATTLNVASASPAESPNRGCILTSTVTVESEECLQLDCVEHSENGACKSLQCGKNQKKKFIDTQATGCLRFAECGAGFTFVGGTPGEPETESMETCDWRPCVEFDTETGGCNSYDCLSRRTVQTERVTYTGAKCVRSAATQEARPWPGAAAAPIPARKWPAPVAGKKPGAKEQNGSFTQQ